MEVEIEVEVAHITEGAILVKSENGIQAWVPKALITDQCGDDYEITSIFMSERHALEKNLL